MNSRFFARPAALRFLLLMALCCTGLRVQAQSVARADTPKGLSDHERSSIRSAYEPGRHEFSPQEDGTHAARNPGLGWQMTFDAKGFTAANGTWTWGLELETDHAPGFSPATQPAQAAMVRGQSLHLQRSEHLTEWFINDQRGLEQGWTLTAPAEIRLRVRGDLQPSVSAQSIVFGGQITYTGLKAWDATGKVIATHFESTAGGFAVRYDDTGAQYPITIDPIAQNAYLKASNTGTNDSFGEAVAISGDTVVVGAGGESSNATGINGNQADNSADSSGAAYVFPRSGNTWTQQAYLKASNAGEFDRFGRSVSVSGNTIVVGASGESSNATGVNGNEADNSAPASGALKIAPSPLLPPLRKSSGSGPGTSRMWSGRGGSSPKSFEPDCPMASQRCAEAWRDIFSESW